MEPSRDSAIEVSKLQEQIDSKIEKVVAELNRWAKEKISAADRFFYSIYGILIIGLLVFIFAYRFTSSSDLEQVISAQDELINTYLSELDKTKKLYRAFHSVVMAKITSAASDSSKSTAATLNHLYSHVRSLLKNADSFIEAKGVPAYMHHSIDHTQGSRFPS